jgi:purine-binding chemotaxis protein CheW
VGRMSEARKRARKATGGAGDERPPEAGPGEAPEEPTAAPTPAAEPIAAAPASAAAPTGWVAHDEPLQASGGAPAGGARLTLPSSGLAADILALAEATDEPAPVVPAPVEPAPAPVVLETAAPRSHNLSFFATSVREERKVAEATEHLATFFLAREEYGVDVRLVQAIIRVSEITTVPRAPGFIKGVINLRGRIIPVVDLRRKLGLGEVDPAARASRIVVVKVRERLVGLLVDGASQVLKVPVASIEAAPEEVVEIDANYIRGVAKLETRLIILMDLPRILALELRDSPEGGAPA